MISHLTKVDILQLNFSYVNEKLILKCFSAGSSSVWEPWTRLLSKLVLKEELTGIEVTTFVVVNNFQKYLSYKADLFFQSEQNFL